MIIKHYNIDSLSVSDDIMTGLLKFLIFIRFSLINVYRMHQTHYIITNMPEPKPVIALYLLINKNIINA